MTTDKYLSKEAIDWLVNRITRPYKAYLVTFSRLDSGVCVVLAQSRGSAKAAATKSAQEASFNVTFTEALAVRAKEFDHLAKPLPCSRSVPKDKCLSFDYALKPCLCSVCKQALSKGKS